MALVLNVCITAKTRHFTEAASDLAAGTGVRSRNKGKERKGLMSQQVFEKLVCTFIFSGLDYCYAVFTGHSKRSIRPGFRTLLLESSQKTSKWPTSLQFSDLCTGFLCQSLDFKMLLMLYKAPNC